jgi:pyruvate formate lyase activating enzyme
VIPGENDSPAELQGFCRWVIQDLHSDLPVHFNRFHPDYRMTDRPETPAETLELARSIAKEVGLGHVYIGNMAGKGYNDTICPGCGSAVILRRGYSIDIKGMDKGSCRRCGRSVRGVFG